MVSISFTVRYTGCFSSYLTDKNGPKAPPDAPPELCQTPSVRKVRQSMTEAKQALAATINFRQYNKHSLDGRAGAYRSSTKKTPYTCNDLKIV